MINYKLFYDFFNIITLDIINYVQFQQNFIKKIIEYNDKNPLFCPDFKYISKWGLILLWLYLIISLLWVIYYIFEKVYEYIKLTSYSYFTSKSLKFNDNPLFIQLNNMYYFNNYFTIDINFVIFILTIIFIIIKIKFLENIINETGNYTSIVFFCYLAVFIGIIYFILIYFTITELGNKLNILTKTTYNNINTDFINKKQICNYLNKKSDIDYNFVYGKCNDVKNSLDINKLYSYISSIMQEINIKNESGLKLEEFYKNLKDSNGKLYKHKIISALFTFQLFKYFLDNDLENEAKDFFSAFNILYVNNINILRTKINPILFLNINNIMIFEDIFEYNNKMKEAFFNNKQIYNEIKFEYNKIQNTIQTIIIDVYNICAYKLISIYVYYFILFILIIIFLILNQYKIKLPNF